MNLISNFPLGLIADDLTGANDSGVQFVHSEQKTTVYLNGLDAHNYSDVMVVSTFSRHMSPREAQDRSYRMTKELLMAGAVRIYKKLDSTMRGNVGAELEGVLQACNCDIVILCPSYPQLGRTLQNGVLCVNERMLSDSEIMKDILSVRSSVRADEIIAEQCSRPIVTINLEDVRKGTQWLYTCYETYIQEGKQILVTDAQTVDDLRAIVSAAQLLKNPYILSGSGGLASAMQHKAPHFSYPNVNIHNGILMFCGSHSQIAHQQIKAALDQDLIDYYEIDPQILIDGDTDPLTILKPLIKGRTIAVAVGRRILDDDVQTVGDRIQDAVGKLISNIFNVHCPGALIVTGGDTALSICRHLGAWGIQISGEVEPGVPFGYLQGRRYNGIPIITKSGSFGDSMIFNRILEGLSANAKQKTIQQ